MVQDVGAAIQLEERSKPGQPERGHDERGGTLRGRGTGTRGGCRVM